jgi:hypothetical protein
MAVVIPVFAFVSAAAVEQLDGGGLARSNLRVLATACGIWIDEEKLANAANAKLAAVVAKGRTGVRGIA